MSEQTKVGVRWFGSPRVVEADRGINIGNFQRGKKLTFYFFSTEYINFNALVTDLFKMYKTRIWVSATNPASFQSFLLPRARTQLVRPTDQSQAGGATTIAARASPGYIRHGQSLWLTVIELRRLPWTKPNASLCGNVEYCRSHIVYISGVAG